MVSTSSKHIPFKVLVSDVNLHLYVKGDTDEVVDEEESAEQEQSTPVGLRRKGRSGRKPKDEEEPGASDSPQYGNHGCSKSRYMVGRRKLDPGLQVPCLFKSST